MLSSGCWLVCWFAAWLDGWRVGWSLDGVVLLVSQSFAWVVGLVGCWCLSWGLHFFMVSREFQMKCFQHQRHQVGKQEFIWGKLWLT